MGTGAAGDHSAADGSGLYIYTECSGGYDAAGAWVDKPGARALLLSPVLRHAAASSVGESLLALRFWFR